MPATPKKRRGLPKMVSKAHKVMHRFTEVEVKLEMYVAEGAL
jgi:hypothetical protein